MYKDLWLMLCARFIYTLWLHENFQIFRTTNNILLYANEVNILKLLNNNGFFQGIIRLLGFPIISFYDTMIFQLFTTEYLTVVFLTFGNCKIKNVKFPTFPGFQNGILSISWTYLEATEVSLA